MPIKDAYEYWYSVARNVFNCYFKRDGLQVALWKIDEFYNSACWKRDDLKKRGNSTWRYQSARANAYKSLYERVYPALGAE